MQKHLHTDWESRFIDVPTLDALAENVRDDVKNLCPVIDARRKKVYACIYTRNDTEKKGLRTF